MWQTMRERAVFLRKFRRRKDGKAYWYRASVESVRVGAKVPHRSVGHLSEEDAVRHLDSRDTQRRLTGHFYRLPSGESEVVLARLFQDNAAQPKTASLSRPKGFMKKPYDHCCARGDMMKFYFTMLVAVLLVGCSGKKPESTKDATPQPPGAASTAPTTSIAIPGTSVRLSPPEGFVAADRFPGFMKESTGSSIMVSEIPGPYGEVTAGFSDKRQIQARGMTLLDHSSVKVDGQEAMLLYVEQPAYGMVFRKWMLAVDQPDGTALIVASFPKSEREEGDALKTAILAATFGKPSDPADALAFVATPVAPFEVAKVMGQNMILSPDGRFPVKDENVPFMILGLSASEDLAIADQRAFAERRVTNTATVRDVTVDQTVPITIGHLSGYATTAKGIGEEAATPLTIYQILLFDKSGYCVIQGVSPTTQKDTFVPIFEQTAKTFKMKDSHNQAIDSDKK